MQEHRVSYKSLSDAEHVQTALIAKLPTYLHTTAQRSRQTSDKQHTSPSSNMNKPSLQYEQLDRKTQRDYPSIQASANIYHIPKSKTIQK